MRSLLVGNATSPLNRALVRRLAARNPGWRFVVYDTTPFRTCPVSDYWEAGAEVVRRFGGAFRLANGRHTRFPYAAWRDHVELRPSGRLDVCHLQMVDPVMALHVGRLREAAKRVIVSFWGSDFYRASPLQRRLQMRICDVADRITFAHQAIAEDFRRENGRRFDDRIREVRFGLDPLPEIDRLEQVESVEEGRRRLGWPPSAPVVVCGYNGSAAQQHFRIIDEMERCRGRIPERTYFVFPMAYGGTADYVRSVAARLKSLPFGWTVDEAFLSGEGLARLRRCADVMVNVQTTDSLSGAMQEHMYSGAVVLNGAWLPYALLETLGAAFLKLQTVADLPEVLAEVLRNLDAYKRRAEVNRGVIRELSHWDVCIRGWERLYAEEEPGA